MKTIQGKSRNQIHFSGLEDLVAANNPVLVPDAFVDKPDLIKMGIRKRPKVNRRNQKKIPAVHCGLIQKAFIRNVYRQNKPGIFLKSWPGIYY